MVTNAIFDGKLWHVNNFSQRYQYFSMHIHRIELELSIMSVYYNLLRIKVDLLTHLSAINVAFPKSSLTLCAIVE